MAATHSSHLLLNCALAADFFFLELVDFYFWFHFAVSLSFRARAHLSSVAAGSASRRQLIKTLCLLVCQRMLINTSKPSAFVFYFRLIVVISTLGENL